MRIYTPYVASYQAVDYEETVPLSCLPAIIRNTAKLKFQKGNFNDVIAYWKKRNKQG
jgi:hypothetical protein